MPLRAFALLTIAVLAAACGGAVSPTPTPTRAPSAPPPSPTAVPSLDPSLSDAGVVGRVTLTGDKRANRDGTYDIVGAAADGSSCETSFEGDEYIANATAESAPDGQPRAMGVSIPVADVPAADGDVTNDIVTGRAFVDFASSNFIGTLYAGEPADDARTTVSIDVTRRGTMLVFDYQGTTWDAVNFSGQLICANAD